MPLTFNNADTLFHLDQLSELIIRPGRLKYKGLTK